MKGFTFAGVSAAIKKNGKKDLGLIFSEKPATAAALFTRNKVVAAPVTLGREKIKAGLCQAILVNSGNANCFTGKKGIEDAMACSKMVANACDIPENLVQVCSTGVIGAPLPLEKFEPGITALKGQLSDTGLTDFADAILTTDLCRKIVTVTGCIDSKTFTITGIAKGSGMIRPDMATMLGFICTDVCIDAETLHAQLTAAAEKSFNRISVDGDTSTNDTILALANGTSGVLVQSESALLIFQQHLHQVCLELAKTIVRDGEGATKLVQIITRNAASESDAYKVCEAVAHSNLVKTALYGEDPNWGRITAAAGRSGAYLDPDLLDLYFDEQPLVLNGCWLGPDAEKKAGAVMKNREITLTLDLKLGQFSDFYWFCDFSEDYVKINADYRS